VAGARECARDNNAVADQPAPFPRAPTPCAPPLAVSILGGEKKVVVAKKKTEEKDEPAAE